MARPRFHVLGGDVSGELWCIATSDDPREAFAELEGMERQARFYGHYVPICVWDDQRDRQVRDLDEALETLEEEAEEHRGEE